MYDPRDLARFALSEFERGLEGLTEEEAQTRLAKADGTQMNAISWTVAHIAGHWLNRPEHLRRFASGSTDPTPPTLAEAIEFLHEGRDWNLDPEMDLPQAGWLLNADDALLSSLPPGGQARQETVGTALMRAVLHTWFHLGEINAIRQTLGHAEIPFVGRLIGNLEWRSEGASA